MIFHNKLFTLVNLSGFQLHTLPEEYSDKTINSSFWCDNNRIFYLTNSPKFVKIYIDCEDNQLFNLDALPIITIKGVFY
jgi:hypothetical protein